MSALTQMMEMMALSSAPTPVAYKAIRIYITDNNGDASYTGIGDCIMALTPGGTTVCSGGTPSASNALGPASQAFNGDHTTPTDGWVTNAGYALPSWLQYQFSTPQVVTELRLYNQWSQYTRVPKDVIIQGTNDMTTYTNIKTFVGLTGWVNNTPKILTLY